MHFMQLAYALASAKIIVTIAYWDAVMEAVEEMKELPKINDFLSTVKEEWLRADAEQLLPKEERRMLFHGLCFVHFCARQYATYAPIITAAGFQKSVFFLFERHLLFLKYSIYYCLPYTSSNGSCFWKNKLCFLRDELFSFSKIISSKKINF